MESSENFFSLIVNIQRNRIQKNKINIKFCTYLYLIHISDTIFKSVFDIYKTTCMGRAPLDVSNCIYNELSYKIISKWKCRQRQTIINYYFSRITYLASFINAE